MALEETGVVLSAIDNFSKQMDSFNKKLNEIGTNSETAGNKTSSLKDQFMSLVPAMTAVGAVMFLKSSIEASMEQEEGLRKLNFAVTATGKKFSDVKPQVDAFTEAVENNTRFSGEIATEAMAKLTRVTGDFATAQRLAKLAMDISATTGKDLMETTTQLGLAFEGNTRGVMMLKREFGAQLEGAKTGTDVLNKLAKAYDGSAESEKSFTKDLAVANHQFEEMQKAIGSQLIPVLSDFMSAIMPLIPAIKDVAVGIGAALSSMITNWITASKIIGGTVSSLYKEIKAAVTGHFAEAVKIQDNWVKTSNDELKNWAAKQSDIIINANSKLVNVYAEAEKKKVELSKNSTAIIAKDSKEDIKKREEDAKKHLEKMVKDNMEFGNTIKELRAKDQIDKIKKDQEAANIMKALREKDIVETTKMNKTLATNAISNAQLSYNERKALVLKFKDDNILSWQEAETTIADLNKQATDDMKKNVDNFLSGFSSSFSSGIGDMLKGTKNMSDGWKSIWDGMGNYALDYLAKIAANAVFGFLGNILTGGLSSLLGFLDAGGEVQKSGMYYLKAGEKVISDSPTMSIAQTGAIKPLNYATTTQSTKNSVTNFSPNINIQGTLNPSDIAESVGKELQRAIRGLGQSSMVGGNIA